MHQEEVHASPTTVDTRQLAMPLLFAEVRMSRQYRMHVLYLPGAATPTFHNYLLDALELAFLDEHDRLTLDVDTVQYVVSTR